MQSFRTEKISCAWTIPLQVAVSIRAPVTGGLTGPPPTASPTAEGLFGPPARDVFSEASRKFSIDALAEREFHWKTALATALCSTLAYQVPAQVIATAKNVWSFQTCETIALDGTECFVASSPDAIVVSFRGTQQITDWLVNLNAISTAAPFGSVHRGFYFAFQSVKSRLEQTLSRLASDSRKIVLTGHSLGGALATIAAAHWQGRFPISGVFTYGQPRVGLTNFRSYMQLHFPTAFYRFVNVDDIVSRVPPGYRHVGRLFHFDGNESRRFESIDRWTDPPSLSESEFQELKIRLQAARSVAPAAMNETLRSNLVQEGFFASVADHAMDRYLGRILARVK